MLAELNYQLSARDNNNIQHGAIYAKVFSPKSRLHQRLVSPSTHDLT